jgi:glycosyltransferase involved in cell wall biosynthesis
VKVLFVPYEKDPKAVARYYQAADVYVHAAKAEAWGLTITEALACGTPVVATAIGGIPEQVKGLRIAHCGLRNSGLNGFGLDKATGILVPSRNAEAMAMGIEHVLRDEALRCQLGENAVRDAHGRFDLALQVEAYLEWYEEIIERKRVKRSTFQPDTIQRSLYPPS